MKTYAYEGGIPYEVEVPAVGIPTWFLESMPCTCRGEAHDECRPCDYCDDEITDWDNVDEDSEGTVWHPECRQEQLDNERFDAEEAEKEAMVNLQRWVQEDEWEVQG